MRFRHGLCLFTLSLALHTTSLVHAQARDLAGEAAMLDALNARRAAQGLSALARHPQLDQAAAAHSADMAARDVLEHVSETSGTPIDRVNAAGLDVAELAENVAMHASALEAQGTLEQSPPHLANMLNDRFTHVGIGSASDERGIYVTQVFARIDAAEAPNDAAPSAMPSAADTAPAVEAPTAPAAGGITASLGGASATVSFGQAQPAAPPPAQVVVQTQQSSIAQPAYAGETAGRPTVMVPGPSQNPLAGYWVCAQNRWWYFPMPANAQPGQQLQADLSVTGAPPGYSETGCVAGQTVQPPAAPAYVSTPQVQPLASPPVYAPAPPVYAPAQRVYVAPRAYYPPPPPVYYPSAPRVYRAPPPPARHYYPAPRHSPSVVVRPPAPRVVAPRGPAPRGTVRVAPSRPSGPRHMGPSRGGGGGRRR